MDTHAHRPDDLSSLERRLAACEPAVAGLDADAMLFAAGRASIRPGSARFVWPGLTGAATALAVVFGFWLAAERAERLTLAEQLRQLSSTSVPTLSPLPAGGPGGPSEPPTTEQRPPNSLLAARQALEQGLDAWPAQSMAGAGAPGPPLPEPPVLQVGWRGALLDP
jgi:hypothetical protein